MKADMGLAECESKYEELYLDYLVEYKKYSKDTITAYTKDIKLFYLFCRDSRELVSELDEKNNKNLEELFEIGVSYYLKHLYLKKYQNNSIYRMRCSLVAYFNYLIEQKVLAGSPFDQVYQIKTKRKLPPLLSEELIVKVTRGLEDNLDIESNKGLTRGFSIISLYLGKRDLLVWEMLYGLGLRISEVTGLRWNDFNPSFKIDQRKDAESGNKYTVLIRGKGNIKRRLPLTDNLVVVLKNYREVYQQVCEESFKKYLSEKNLFNESLEWVFLNHRGLPITIRGVRHAFMERVKKVGGESEGVVLYPHALRHAIATHLLENGADIKRVQQLLRHKSIQTTQIYTHISKRHLKEKYTEFHPLNRIIDGKS